MVFLHRCAETDGRKYLSMTGEGHETCKKDTLRGSTVVANRREETDERRCQLPLS